MTQISGRITDDGWVNTKSTPRGCNNKRPVFDIAPVVVFCVGIAIEVSEVFYELLRLGAAIAFNFILSISH